jgi:hypothetical protein
MSLGMCADWVCQRGRSKSSFAPLMYASSGSDMSYLSWATGIAISGCKREKTSPPSKKKKLAGAGEEKERGPRREQVKRSRT